MPTLSVTPPVAPLDDASALALADVTGAELEALLGRASALRDAVWGSTLTFSPKVFLPLTNLCRNRCDYCSFRKSPGDPGAWTMSHAQVVEWLDRARDQGCVEALFCLGDKPEGAFAAYRDELGRIGHASTVEYLRWAAEAALERGLLPHTNAGVLSHADMTALRPVNASLGLMLENISARLCDKGMAHHRAPDKRPAVRMKMMREAGELRIPFTTGILLGIGETRLERVQSLLAIAELQREHGHIQEVIIQNFTARPEIVMAEAPEPEAFEMAHAVALARLILPAEVSVQAPPNLNPSRTALLIRAGINDFGGSSPVTPDYINPRNPWPHLATLFDACAREGFELRPRLPVYPRYVAEPGWLDPTLTDPVAAQAARLDSVRHPNGLAPERPLPGGVRRLAVHAESSP
jgi:FO synthase